MIPKSYLVIAAKILKRQSRFAIFTKMDVDNYQEVVNLWKKYRFFKELPPNIKEDYTLSEVFKFHLNNIANHAILYYSSKLDNVLLMYKVNDKFFNIVVPSFSLNGHKKSVIAVLV